MFAGIGTLPVADLRSLYNGNITSMAVNIGKFNSTTTPAGDSALLYNYKYDQLNRLIAMDAFRGLNTTNNTWSNSLTKLTQYQERITYDANGNILRYKRNGNLTATPIMDSLTYKYTPGTNQLNWVKDSVTNAALYPNDRETQAAANYTYDAIGNLTKDAKDSIASIAWNVYGKIDSILRTPSTARPVSKIKYTYDAMGNRISKRVQKLGTKIVDYTWYVRDASGNVMSIYTYSSDSSVASTLSVGNLIQTDVYLYGSSRLGPIFNAANGSYYKTINDKLPTNRAIFMDDFTYNTVYNKFESSTIVGADDELAKQARQAAVAFVGSNTVSDAKSLEAKANKDHHEIFFLGTIDATKEIRLSEIMLPSKAYAKDANGESIKLGDYLNNDNPVVSVENQLKSFLWGHTHQLDATINNGVDPKLPTNDGRNPYTGYNNGGGDYSPVLRREVNEPKPEAPWSSITVVKTYQTPALIVTHTQMTIYGTGTELLKAVHNPYDSVTNKIVPVKDSFINFKFIKK